MPRPVCSLTVAFPQLPRCTDQASSAPQACPPRSLRVSRPLPVAVSCSQCKRRPRAGSLCRCQCGKKQKEVRRGNTPEISHRQWPSGPGWSFLLFPSPVSTQSPNSSILNASSSRGCTSRPEPCRPSALRTPWKEAPGGRP